MINSGAKLQFARERSARQIAHEIKFYSLAE